MKNLILGLFAFTLFSCSNDDDVKTQQYITDDDFKIKITSWISYSDFTDDGIENYVIDEQGSGETSTFTKATGEISSSDGFDSEFASSSNYGLLIFNNYWGTTPKIVDFTIDNEFTILYDSRNDPESLRFELSKTIGYFEEI